MIIYMVRHGQTDLNKKGLMQGISNTPLNKIGIKEAKKAKEKLKNIKFDLCFSSPLKRALDTAKIIVDNKCKIICDDLLLERDLGDFEGKSYDSYKKFNYWNLKKNLDDEGVEPVKNIFERAKTFLDKIKKENKTILVVSHHAVIRALHFVIVGYDDETNLLSFHPKNAEIYKYEI